MFVCLFVLALIFARSFWKKQFLSGIGAVPIVDAEARVVGIYSRSDITFLATAEDPEAVLRVC